MSASATSSSGFVWLAAAAAAAAGAAASPRSVSRAAVTLRTSSSRRTGMCARMRHITMSAEIYSSPPMHDLSLVTTGVAANEVQPEGYQQPHEDLVRLVDADANPSVSIQPRQKKLVALLGIPALPPLAQISKPELRLAGFRIDPNLFIPAKLSFYTSFGLQWIDQGEINGPRETIPVEFEGAALVDGHVQYAAARWSPDGSRIAFSVYRPQFGLELYMLDVSCVQRSSAPGAQGGQQQKLIARPLRFESDADHNARPTRLHAATGELVRWAPDSQRLLVGLVDEHAVESYVAKHAGRPKYVRPVVEDFAGGKPRPGRTYQDLLRDANDVEKFRLYASCSVKVVDVEACRVDAEMQDVCVRSATWSPDSRYVLLDRYAEPFPLFQIASRFARKIDIFDVPLNSILRDTPKAGALPFILAAHVADLPVQDAIPISFDGVSAEPRNFAWRSDADVPTLTFVKALDDGDPKKEAEFRDAIYSWSAPFTQRPTCIMKLKWRFSSMLWGSEHVALVTERWYKTRSYKTHILRPGVAEEGVAAQVSDSSVPHDGTSPQAGSAARSELRPPITAYESSEFPEALVPSRELLGQDNWEDVYGDPGSPMVKVNENNKTVLRLVYPDDQRSRTLPWLLMSNAGNTPDGAQPFVSLLDTSSGRQTKLWQSAPPRLESLNAILNEDERTGLPSEFLVLRQAKDDFPNYYAVDGTALVEKGISAMQQSILDADDASGAVSHELESAAQPIHCEGSIKYAVTEFKDPCPELRDVKRSQVFYKRDDGVELNANLYLPPGFTPGVDPPRPLILWAYPREFKSKEFAGQNRDSPHRFVSVNRSPLYWLARGFAILDGPLMPIIGVGEEEPNDRFIEQLTASARAACEYVVREGIAHKDKLCVAGHSYGGYMTINLLCHAPELFCCGIARSGAYNRTLTPFGFQGEERTLWEAPEIYQKMSVYNYAHKLEKPVLLIHGEADANPGTFPIQTERFYQAAKGHGKVARMVLLPYEEHGYQARESILHTMWEMDRWISKYTDWNWDEQRALLSAPAAAGAVAGTDAAH
ncbi:putative glutamyl endopeptidase, chloroplastic [Porphyridium purpureum]|uniref:Putative glutamyl endopeptidase, chloroplastic n=1 Tax=Porphyridium purpureum TaxID=35688 RepID=A0A5J4YKP9_PORPP|nr:putative glutamyl endopeptidase, chloroplastic [Porphyridium purpureum]|eukprot:POR2087..scf291_13